MYGKQAEKRIQVLNPEICFEFTIPDRVPEENTRIYAWEKLRRICWSLSKSGLKVTPVIPPEYTANLRYPLRDGAQSTR